MQIPPLPPDSDKWFDNLAFTCLAAVAGLLGHVMRSMNDRRTITWERSIVETLTSGLIGYLTVLLCRATGVISLDWMGFIAGVLGWLGGAASMVLFERAVRKKLGLDDVTTTGGDIHQGSNGQSPSLGNSGAPAGDDNRGT